MTGCGSARRARRPDVRCELTRYGFPRIWVRGRRETHAHSRRAERIGGEELFDRDELPDALRCLSRAFVGEVILVQVLARLGVSFGLLAFESRKLD